MKVCKCHEILWDGAMSTPCNACLHLVYSKPKIPIPFPGPGKPDRVYMSWDFSEHSRDCTGGCLGLGTLENK